MKNKIITSALIILGIILLLLMPNCLATDSSEIVEFKDQSVKEYFIYGYYEKIQYNEDGSTTELWGIPMDENGDGEISVEEMAKIESIYLNGEYYGITDYSFLEYCENLRKLQLVNCEIEDISFLQKFTNLEYLSLAQNNISDISMLKEFEKLEELYLYNNNISDASVVSELTNLKILSLGNNKLKSIPDLSKITAFNDIDIYNKYGEYNIYAEFYGNEITDISALENTIFKRISLYENKISDISALATMSNLQIVNLSSNEITDISNLPKTMTSLDLCYNKINDISHIKNLTELTYLNLSRNNITDISSLEGLSKIEVLDLSTNPISDISPISRTVAYGIYLVDTLVNPYDESTFHVLCTMKEYGTYIRLGDCSQFLPQTGTDELGFTYELNSEQTGYKITKFENNEIKDLKIPSKYNDLPVVELAESLFSCKTNLVNVILPDNITSLPMNLFQQCWNLKSVTLPENSTSITIYPNAFAGCDVLEKLVVFSNIEEIISGKATVTLNGETKEIEWKGFYPSEFSCSENFAIHGYLDSYAKEYADANEYKFVAIDAYTTEKTEEVTVGEEKVTVMPTEKKTTVEKILTATNFPAIDIYTIKVLDANGNEKAADAKVGSRNIIQITDEEGQVLAEYTIVVSGDVNGDGETKIFDSFQILKDVLMSVGETIDAIELMIRDFNNDGNVRIYDAFQFLKEAISK